MPVPAASSSVPERSAPQRSSGASHRRWCFSPRPASGASRSHAGITQQSTSLSLRSCSKRYLQAVEVLYDLVPSALSFSRPFPAPLQHCLESRHILSTCP
eukprot:747942-Hanusia_phi.AAC.3